jgi:hypothetical protein
VTKSELIKKLQDIPGDPNVCLSVFRHDSFPGNKIHPNHEPVTVESVKIHFASGESDIVVLIRHGMFPSGSGYKPELVKPDPGTGTGTGSRGLFWCSFSDRREPDGVPGCDGIPMVRIGASTYPQSEARLIAREINQLLNPGTVEAAERALFGAKYTGVPEAVPVEFDEQSGTLTCSVCGATEAYSNLSWVPDPYMCPCCVNGPRIPEPELKVTVKASLCPPDAWHTLFATFDEIVKAMTPDPDSVDGLIAKLQALPPDVRKREIYALDWDGQYTNPPVRVSSDEPSVLLFDEGSTVPDPDSVDGLIAKLQALPPDVRKLPVRVMQDDGATLKLRKPEPAVEEYWEEPTKVVVL